jgi:2-polyprenyl-3-methyl-5-hydroxy-6-metoxy-1,4-benzoquinol methylase/spore maturation protein CgeB
MNDTTDLSLLRVAEQASDAAASPIPMDRISELYNAEIFTKATAESARRRIHWMCGQVSGGRALDVGCSQGIATVLMAREGVDVTGLDSHPEAMAYARGMSARETAAVQARITWLEGDFWDLPAAEQYDTIVLGEVIEHQAAPARFLAKAVRHLAPDGRLVLTTPFGLLPHDDHKVTLFPADLARMAEQSGLQVEQLDVTDGYIRMLARHAVQGATASPGADSLLALTEKGALESQERLYERVGDYREKLRKKTDSANALEQRFHAAAQEALAADARRAQAAQELATAQAAVAALEARLAEMRASAEAAPGPSREALELVERRHREKVQGLKQAQKRMHDVGEAVLKHLVRADQLRAASERRVAKVQGQLSYLLGSQLVAAGANPLKWLALPWKLQATARDWRRQRTAIDKPSQAWRAVGAGMPWVRESALVKREPQWLEVRTGQAAAVRVVVRLQFFAEPVESGALLLVQCLDEAGRALALQEKGFQPRPGAEQGVHALALATDLEITHAVQVPVPAGCAIVRLSVLRDRAGSVGRVDFEQVVAGESIPGFTKLAQPELRVHSATGPLRDRGQGTAADEAQDQGRLRALTLLDEFSEECLRPDLNLVPLSRKQWKEQIADGGIDLFFAESVWRGNAGSWNYCMTKFSGERGRELQEVLQACRERGIPTVFWNKEDPANFEVFIEVARAFDHVFTTDAGCVPRYRELLGHDRVHVLPFAAQPAMHNPILQESRQARVAFAGSWNGRKYPARARWLETLLGEAMRRGVLDIFDRYADSTDEALKFPREFQPSVRGAVAYGRISEAVYKRYAALFNVNSVEDSESMVARRIYELAACGTPVISSPSPALRGPFADVIDVVADASEARASLDALLGDELAGLRRAVRGVRLVHSAHTYRHRLEQVRRVIGLAPAPGTGAEAITAICVSKRPEMVARVGAMLNAQTHPALRVIFVAHGEGFRDEDIRAAFDPRLQVQVLHLPAGDTVLADGLNLAWREATTSVLAKIDDDDHYGPDYLFDAALALRYSRAGLVGKASYFCFVEQSDQMGLRFPSKHYRFTNRVHGGTLVWDRRITGDLQFERVRQGTDSAFLRSLGDRGVRIYSTDPFNFVHVRYANAESHTWRIEDDEFMKKARVIGQGLDLGTAFA